MKKLDEQLPPQIKRYLKASIPQTGGDVSKVLIQQKGELRSDADKKRWMSFAANQALSARVCAFQWRASVKVLPFFHISVLDSYHEGVGSGEIQVFRHLTLARESNSPELNSGALHRYLAEAPWCPHALLPRQELSWSTIDSDKARASLRDKGNSVELDFTFSPKGDIVGVFTKNRWGRFNDGHWQRPWKGIFEGHFEVKGIRIPAYGEVAWQINGEWKSVWKGEVVKARFI